VSSGARPKQVKLDGHAAETFTGDLIVPEGFKFSVECKAVNKEVDFLDRSILFDRFLNQAAVDAASIGKIPLLCWKRNRRGWIAAVPMRAFRNVEYRPSFCTLYLGWLICRLDTLLEADENGFWFEESPTDAKIPTDQERQKHLRHMEISLLGYEEN
jgi:hypothetical protein